MNPKWIYAIFGIVLLSGMAFAISGATVETEVERGKWAGNTSGSVTTEGGNVSGVNVSAGVSTEKWASYYGDVVGSIVLADSAATSVYTWAWATTDGGEVCVSRTRTMSGQTLRLQPQLWLTLHLALQLLMQTLQPIH